MILLKTVRHSLLYVKHVFKYCIEQKSITILPAAFRNYTVWIRDYLSGETTLTLRTPWICYDAIEYLRSVVKADMKIFEYGSGGSTLFWSDHCSQVVSVEHDEKWINQMFEVISAQSCDNIVYHSILPGKCKESQERSFENLNHYKSSNKQYEDFSFEEYASIIDKYPDHYFDIIFVDGRARNSCMHHSFRKLKKGGILILDNSERIHYSREFMDKFRRERWQIRHFEGICPFCHGGSRTTFFKYS